MGNSLGQTPPTHPWADPEQERLNSSTLPQSLERVCKPRNSHGFSGTISAKSNLNSG